MTFRTLAAAFALSLVAAFPALAQQTPPALRPADRPGNGEKGHGRRRSRGGQEQLDVVHRHHRQRRQHGDDAQGRQHAARLDSELAEGKAQTALDFKLPTKALEDAIAAGGAGLRLTTLNNITPLEGGLPIVADGKIIGAIGVSGVLSAQDAQIARAGIQALGATRRLQSRA